MTTKEINNRLEYLRGEIKAERISYGEIVELQSLSKYIKANDVELLQWAGVEENSGGYKYIPTQELLKQKVLTYQQILNLKKRMTGYSKKPEKPNDFEWADEYGITPDHTAKGLEYLRRVAFKPSKLAQLLEAYKSNVIDGNLLDSAIRSNSPLGYREIDILLHFNHFTFTGFYDASNMYQHEAGFRALYPLWKCYGIDGDSFEYYIEGGAMNIVG